MQTKIDLIEILDQVTENHKGYNITVDGEITERLLMMASSITFRTSKKIWAGITLRLSAFHLISSLLQMKKGYLRILQQ